MQDSDGRCILKGPEDGPLNSADGSVSVEVETAGSVSPTKRETTQQEQNKSKLIGCAHGCYRGYSEMLILLAPNNAAKISNKYTSNNQKQTKYKNHRTNPVSNPHNTVSVIQVQPMRIYTKKIHRSKRPRFFLPTLHQLRFWTD